MSSDKIHHVREISQSEGSTRTLALDLDRLLDLLDRPIAFHRVFVELTGSVTAALMLSQGLYWTRIKRRDSPESEGWFYKTQTEWTDETGMGRSEQETARKRLRQTPFWQEQLRGIPAKLYFRIDLPHLAEALLTQPPKTGTPRENREQNHQDAEIQHTSLQGVSKQARDDTTDQSAGCPQPITETTAETTLSETPTKREENVENVGSNRTKRKRRTPVVLDEQEQALVDELVHQFDDEKSRGAFARIVSPQGLGYDGAYRLMCEVFEFERAHKIKKSPGAAYIDLAKRDAARQGIDLGFREKGVSHGETD
jgi:hypothetical protein